MPLGMEVCVDQSHVVSDRDPAVQKEYSPSNFRPMSVMVEQLDGSRCHLVGR